MKSRKSEYSVYYYYEKEIRLSCRRNVQSKSAYRSKSINKPSNAFLIRLSVINIIGIPYKTTTNVVGLSSGRSIRLNLNLRYHLHEQ